MKHLISDANQLETSSAVLEEMALLCEALEERLNVLDNGFIAHSTLIDADFDHPSLVWTITSKVKNPVHLAGLNQIVKLYFLQFDPIQANVLGIKIYAGIEKYLGEVMVMGVDLNEHKPVDDVEIILNSSMSARAAIYSFAVNNFNDYSRQPFVKPLFDVLRPR